MVCWYLICMKKVPELNAPLSENLLMALGIVVFLLCGYNLNSIIGFVVYIAVITLLCLLLARKAFVETAKMGVEMVMSKLKKRG